MTSEPRIDKNSFKDLFNNLDSTYQKILLTSSWLLPDVDLPLEVLMRVSKNDQEVEIKQRLGFLASMGFLGRSENGFIINHKVSSLIKEISNPILAKEMLHAVSRAMHEITNSLEKAEEFEPYALQVDKLAQQGQIHKIATAGLLFGLLGRYKLQTGENDEAVKFIRRALLIVEKVSGIESEEHTENLNNLGSALHKMGRFEDAKKCFEQAIIIDSKILDKNDPAVAIGHNNLGQVMIDMNNLDNAIIHLEIALEINTDNFGKDHPLVASGNYNLGMALLNIGDLPRARAQLELALAKRKKIFGDNSLEVAVAHHGLGMAMQTIGNSSGAIEHYERAIKIFELNNTPENFELAASYANLGGVFHANRDFINAKEYYQKSFSIMTSSLSENDKNLKDLEFQMKLVDEKTTMAELLEKMETGEHLSEPILEFLSDRYSKEEEKLHN